MEPERETVEDGQPQDPSRGVARLALELHGEPSVERTVEKVLGFALGAVGADHAGVILLHGKGRFETVAATDPVVAKLDALQMEIGEGPDITVFSERLSVIVSDTHFERRWPAWASMVSEGGMRSLLSVRLYTSDAALGTLNFYARRPDAFDVDDQAVAHILSRHASVALAAARQTETDPPRAPDGLFFFALTATTAAHHRRASRVPGCRTPKTRTVRLCGPSDFCSGGRI